MILAWASPFNFVKKRSEGPMPPNTPPVLQGIGLGPYTFEIPDRSCNYR